MRGHVYLLKSLAAIAVLLGLPAAASAAVYTPNPADLDDLDHTKAYAWKIDVSAIKTHDVTSASITFRQMYNWDSNANMLFIHLIDPNASMLTPNMGAGSTVFQFTDQPDNTAPDDAFDPDLSWMVSDTFLTQRAFQQLGAAPELQGGSNTGPGDAFDSKTSGVWTDADTTGNGGTWTAVQNGTDSQGRKLYDYTYTFSATERDTFLDSYIDDGWIALGFDPDCHFYNNGVTFNIASVPNVQVPEPATLALVGTGLAFGAWRRRRGAPSRTV